jgi:hypothetical protein
MAGEIKELADRRDIFIHNYFTGEMTHNVNLISHPDGRLSLRGKTWFEKALKLTTELGAKGLGSHFGTIPSNALHKKEYDYYIENIIDHLVYFSEIAANEGHEILMLEQMYTPTEPPYTIKQTYEIFNRINKRAKLFVSPVIDLGHSCCLNFPHDKADEDPYNWLREFGSLAEVIHLQQTTYDSSHHWPFTDHYNKKGIITAEKVIEALEASGSKENYLILEIFFSLSSNDNQILDDMIETVNYWKSYLK